MLWDGKIWLYKSGWTVCARRADRSAGDVALGSPRFVKIGPSPYGAPTVHGHSTRGLDSITNDG